MPPSPSHWGLSNNSPVNNHKYSQGESPTPYIATPVKQAAMVSMHEPNKTGI